MHILVRLSRLCLGSISRQRKRIMASVTRGETDGSRLNTVSCTTPLVVDAFLIPNTKPKIKSAKQ